MLEKIQIPSEIETAEPYRWATWQYDSPHLPSSCHESVEALQRVQNWLREIPTVEDSSSVWQKYLLIFAMLLRDCQICNDIAPDEPVPKGLPGYFGTSPASIQDYERAIEIAGVVLEQLQNQSHPDHSLLQEGAPTTKHTRENATEDADKQALAPFPSVAPGGESPTGLFNLKKLATIFHPYFYAHQL